MDESAQCWQDVAAVLAAGVDRLVLYGPPGTGKTYAALHLETGGAGAERLTCTEDLTSAEVIGSWMPRGDGSWAWRLGPALRAWTAAGGRGGRLVVDEIDRASGDALSTLLTVTDSTASARWRNPETGEWLTPGPEFSVVVTTNLDELEDLPAPLRDRFAVRIRIDRPPVAAVASLSGDLRQAALAGSLAEGERRTSLRSFYAFDQLRNHLGGSEAARLVFGEERAPDVLDALRVAALR